MSNQVEFWRMGATPVPCTDIGELARGFEAAGWDGLAVGEAAGLLPDPYVVLGLAAAATTTLKVGTAVAVPLRHPLLAAGLSTFLIGGFGKKIFRITSALLKLWRVVLPILNLRPKRRRSSWRWFGRNR